jgi:hypothetical protein
MFPFSINPKAAYYPELSRTKKKSTQVWVGVNRPNEAKLLNTRIRHCYLDIYFLRSLGIYALTRCKIFERGLARRANRPGSGCGNTRAYRTPFLLRRPTFWVCEERATPNGLRASLVLRITRARRLMESLRDERWAGQKSLLFPSHSSGAKWTT